MLSRVRYSSFSVKSSPSTLVYDLTDPVSAVETPLHYVFTAGADLDD
jgi:hypothetical protein